MATEKFFLDTLNKIAGPLGGEGRGTRRLALELFQMYSEDRTDKDRLEQLVRTVAAYSDNVHRIPVLDYQSATAILAILFHKVARRGRRVQLGCDTLRGLVRATPCWPTADAHLVQEAGRLITLTEYSQQVDDQEAPYVKLFLDASLSFLAWPEKAAGVWSSADDDDRGRLHVVRGLEALLERPKIFFVLKELEAAARLNITKETKRWTATTKKVQTWGGRSEM